MAALERAVRVILLALSMTTVVGSAGPASAVCPTNNLSVLGVETNTTNPTAGAGRSSPCSFGGTSSASASYNLVNGVFAASGQGGYDCGGSGISTTADIFRLVGPATIDPVSIMALLQISASWAGGPAAGFGAQAYSELREGTSNSQAYGSHSGGPSIATLRVTIVRAVGDSFDLHIVVAGYAGSQAYASINATLSFAGLPPGYAVVSCQGYISDPSVPVRASSWGRIKTLYR